MPYSLMADLVLVIHLAFVIFVVLGGLLVLFHSPRWAWVHLPAAIWGVVIEIQSWTCPLTPLENSLRLRAGELGYAGGFVEHYVIPILYPAALTRSIQVWLGLFALVLNVTVYSLVWRRYRRSD